MLEANTHKKYSASELHLLLSALREYDTHLQNDVGAFLTRYVDLVWVTSEEQMNPDLEQRLPDQGNALFVLFERFLDLMEELLIVHLNYRHGIAFVASKGRSFEVWVKPDIVISQEQMRKTIADLLDGIPESDVAKLAVLERCAGLLEEARPEKMSESYGRLVEELEQIEREFDTSPWARCLSGLAHLCVPGGFAPAVESLFQALLRMKGCVSRLDRALLCSTINSYCSL